MTLIIDDLDGNVTTIRVQHNAKVMVVKEPAIAVNPNYRLHPTVEKGRIDESIMDKPNGRDLELGKWYTVE